MAVLFKEGLSGKLINSIKNNILRHAEHRECSVNASKDQKQDCVWYSIYLLLNRMGLWWSCSMTGKPSWTNCQLDIRRWSKLITSLQSEQIYNVQLVTHTSGFQSYTFHNTRSCSRHIEPYLISDLQLLLFIPQMSSALPVKTKKCKMHSTSKKTDLLVLIVYYFVEYLRLIFMQVIQGPMQKIISSFIFTVGITLFNQAFTVEQ